MNLRSFRHISNSALILLTAATALSAVHAAAQAAAGSDTAASCGQMSQADVPASQTIVAKSLGMDSGHLKPGKEIWFKNVKGVSYPGCTIEPDAVIYAKVVSVSSSKDGSEFSLDFDRADCSGGHDKQAFKMRLISLKAPADEIKTGQSSTSTEVAGRGRQESAPQTNNDAADTSPKASGDPNTIHPGVVVGIPNTKLEPMGGTGCSDRITSTNSKIKFQPNSQFVLVVTSAQ